jgi:pimeloyl-ACP methyl ester carboxylesterase
MGSKLNPEPLEPDWNPIVPFDAGSGPPLIVIPGVQGRWEWVRPALDRLQKGCRTISYSLCGDFGSGRRMDPRLGFDNYLRQLYDVLDRAHVDRAAVCGISYGGFVALRYAATRPERISALIIASSPSPGWAPNPIQRSYISSPWRTTPKFIATSPLRIWPEICAALDTRRARLAFLAGHGLRVAGAPMIPALMASRIVEQQSIDFAPDTARIQAPTLIVTGEPGLDQIVPVESTVRYLSMIPGARHATIPRTGHLGLVTRPEMFAAVVGDFVREAAKETLKFEV